MCLRLCTFTDIFFIHIRSFSMPDYGHTLEFGYFLSPDTDDPAGLLATARLLDDLGYDWVSIQDHPYNPGHFDALALMAVILGQTQRLRGFHAVVNLSLRPPAMLAKEAASLDQLSSGRFELGLGTGAYGGLGASMGGAARTAGESYQALNESIEVIRAMWSERPNVYTSGQHYRLSGA
jgi:alkanesulfonate monooxygenase SsuD/methylene tetrahydromethanopterin reductase-like flavin-dependent oxidoreductase (luciferase family)